MDTTSKRKPPPLTETEIEALLSAIALTEEDEVGEKEGFYNEETGRPRSDKIRALGSARDKLYRMLPASNPSRAAQQYLSKQRC